MVCVFFWKEKLTERAPVVSFQSSCEGTDFLPKYSPCTVDHQIFHTFKAAWGGVTM